MGLAHFGDLPLSNYIMLISVAPSTIGDIELLIPRIFLSFDSFVAWAEGGDHFRFIKGCITELMACFSHVRVVNVDTRAAWYICTPLQE
ncbi:MAG: hypothetical protein RBR15_12595 [Sphaerochaeta sp.]|nr:hypothetical protein [Sphaerochaeta sp.]